MRKFRIPYFMVLVCALCWVSSAQGASYRWYMDTDTGKSVAMDEVEYLLRSDGTDDFAVVLKNGDPVVGVSRVTFSQKQSTAIGAQQVGVVRFYPNPVQSTLYMSGLPEGCRVEIVALDGRVLKLVAATGSNLSIPVADLPQGSYLLKTASTVLKFIKR